MEEARKRPPPKPGETITNTEIVEKIVEVINRQSTGNRQYAIRNRPPKDFPKPRQTIQGPKALYKYMTY